jgi:hypothetical protein
LIGGGGTGAGRLLPDWGTFVSLVVCSEFVEVDVSLIDSFEELWLVDLLGDLELEEGLSRWRDGDKELFLTILTFSFWGVGF